MPQERKDRLLPLSPLFKESTLKKQQVFKAFSVFYCWRIDHQDSLLEKTVFLILSWNLKSLWQGEITSCASHTGFAIVKAPRWYGTFSSLLSLRQIFVSIHISLLYFWSQLGEPSQSFRGYHTVISHPFNCFPFVPVSSTLKNSLGQSRSKACNSLFMYLILYNPWTMIYFVLVSACYRELKTKKTVIETVVNLQILLTGLIKLLWYQLGEFDS